MPQIYNLDNYTIGQILNKCRKDLNLEIKDVCAYLKVKESEIISLEEDRFDNTSNHLYRRGLIRSYGKFLRVETALLEAKIKELPFESNVANKKHQLLNIGENIDLTPDREMFFNFLVIAALISLILLAVYNRKENKDNVLDSNDVISRFEKATGIEKKEEVIEEEKIEESPLIQTPAVTPENNLTTEENKTN